MLGTPTHTQVLASVGSKGACLRMREIDLMRIGPIVVVNGSNDASSWALRPFYGFVNKRNIFHIFTQKCEKLHYALRHIRRAINWKRLKIDVSCFHKTGGRASEWCHSNLRLPLQTHNQFVLSTRPSKMIFAVFGSWWFISPLRIVIKRKVFFYINIKHYQQRSENLGRDGDDRCDNGIETNPDRDGWEWMWALPVRLG